MKKLKTQLNLSVVLQPSSNFHLGAENGEYTPKNNDIARLYKQGNDILLQVDFVKDDRLPPGFEISDSSSNTYKRIKTMTYPNAVSYLKNKGYIVKDISCFQLCLYHNDTKLTELSGCYEEVWKLPLKVEAVNKA